MVTKDKRFSNTNWSMQLSPLFSVYQMNRPSIYTSQRHLLPGICIVSYFVLVKSRWNTFWILRCDVRYDFRIKTMIGSSLPQVFFFIGEPMSYIRYLCGVFFVFVFVFFFFVFAYIGVQHIFGCVFVFVFLRLGYPISTGSLDCPFLIATLVFSNVYFLLTDNWPISFSFKHYCKWMKHTSYATQQVIYVSLDN